MICITKNNKDAFTIEYKLEVYTDNRLLYNKTVDINKHGITDEQRDRAAKLKLLQYLLQDNPIEMIEEFSNLIPMYEANNDKN